MKRFVDVTSLNLRSEARVHPSTKLGALFLGAPVEVTDAAETNGFVAVTAELDGQTRNGFVSEKFLRDPVSDTREALIAQSLREWHRFARGLGQENVDPFFRFIGEMWQSIGLDLNGHDRDMPWSAAAISFIVRRSGPQYARFNFAAGHSKYMHDSIVKRDAGDRNTPFWGFRIDERRPQLGDIVCKWRENEVDFDTARRRNDFKSHCDIVVSIDSPNNTLLALGGNVAHSAKLTTYKLTAGDFLADADQVIALLANITDG